METKPLLYGLIGFFIGGLIVSVAATQLQGETTTELSMSQMTQQLQNKSGEQFDKEFITHMIAHHQAAVDMAKLSAGRAQHQEIKDLSLAIIAAQQKEMSDMQRWQTDWGLSSDDTDTAGGGHGGH